MGLAGELTQIMEATRLVSSSMAAGVDAHVLAAEVVLGGSTIPSKVWREFW